MKKIRQPAFVRFILCLVVLAIHFISIERLHATDRTPPSNISVERWGRWEGEWNVGDALKNIANPFTDIQFSAVFTEGDRTKSVPGFYDGDGIYRLRYCPTNVGECSFVTRSNLTELNGLKGTFQVIKPSSKNHGAVRVANQFHFAYEDGKPFYPIGTTCYAWIHQSEDLIKSTLSTLTSAPFNKLRMCIYPKSYDYNQTEPVLFPFEGKPKQWNTAKFNPAFFRHLEQQISKLQELEIEADLILLHPYDKGHWGFDRLSANEDDRYIRYVVARLASFRNVWWSLANEYDFMEQKTEADFERIGQLIRNVDPHDRLRSIHNGTKIYNQTADWITHVSIQNGSAVAETGRAVLYRDVYRKPIVLDEVKYEGNLPKRWGNISAQEMVHRFWIGTVEGTYVGHGETYLDPHSIWWSHGGTLRGQSPERIRFLRAVIESGPPKGIEPIDKWQESQMGGRHGDNYFLVYLGRQPLKSWKIAIPTKERDEKSMLPPMRIEIIDAWNMTATVAIEKCTFQKTSPYYFTCVERETLDLPGTPMTAIRITPAK